MFEKLVKERRSIRKFKKIPVSDNDLKALCRTILLSPSSRNFSPWEFIMVKDKVMLAKLSKSKMGAEFLKEAPLGIVIAVDPKKSDVWVEDCSIAATFLLMQAQDLGLGACWVQIRRRYYSEDITSEEYVRNLLNIPLEYRVDAIIGIGHPDEYIKPHSRDEQDWTKIHDEQFSRNLK